MARIIFTINALIDVGFKADNILFNSYNNRKILCNIEVGN